MLKHYLAAKNWKDSLRDEEGASMVEYGLLVALIAIVVAGAAALLGTGISDLFDEARGLLGGAAEESTTE